MTGRLVLAAVHDERRARLPLCHFLELGTEVREPLKHPVTLVVAVSVVVRLNLVEVDVLSVDLISFQYHCIMPDENSTEEQCRLKQRQPGFFEGAAGGIRAARGAGILCFQELPVSTSGSAEMKGQLDIENRLRRACRAGAGGDLPISIAEGHAIFHERYGLVGREKVGRDGGCAAVRIDAERFREARDDFQHLRHRVESQTVSTVGPKSPLWTRLPQRQIFRLRAILDHVGVIDVHVGREESLGHSQSFGARSRIRAMMSANFGRGGVSMAFMA